MLPTGPTQATPRVHHLARPGTKQGGKQWWDFWTWIDGPADVLDRITRFHIYFQSRSILRSRGLPIEPLRSETTAKRMMSLNCE
jgi:hypothetical protein